MPNPNPYHLSVVIVAQNEERTIGDVLTAVKPIAGELILVDSGSTDRTAEIAEDLGARVVHRKWEGYAAQKNFALSLAGGNWILNLDADETATPDLVSEIGEILSGTAAEQYSGFRIPRMLYIGDQAVKHGGFYPDAQLRLIRKGAGMFKDRLVHEAICVDGQVGRLKHHMLHKAYQNVDGFAKAMDEYARLSAREFSRRNASGWKTSRLNEFIHPKWTFFFRYFLRGGFLDGKLGWKLNSIYADYVRKKVCYLRQLTAAPDTHTSARS